MCLTVPLEIKTINDKIAELSDGRLVNLSLIEKPEVGDFVLVNADLALSKVSASEAQEIINYLK